MQALATLIAACAWILRLGFPRLATSTRRGASGAKTFPRELQNTRRRLNCMKRGVVRVEMYFPNSVGSNDSEGCAARTS